MLKSAVIMFDPCPSLFIGIFIKSRVLFRVKLLNQPMSRHQESFRDRLMKGL